MSVVDRSLLASLCQAHGPSGREDAIRDIVRPRLEAICDTVTTDALGNLIGHRPGPTSAAPLLMLAAHMDEISLMVSHIDDRGFVHVLPVGGWDARTLVGQHVVVAGREDVRGVVGLTPTHLLDEAARNKTPRVEELAIDTGQTPERVRELIRAGDMATRVRALEPLGDLLTGKSLDDRVGIAVMLTALELVANARVAVAAVATTQEEVGLRGAGVAATALAPRIALAIDTCPSDDGPGGHVNGPTTRLGRGAAIRVMDASAICDPRLVDLLTTVAADRSIPVQFHVANRGGTDTGALQRAADGAIAGCVSIPTRYVHSSVECCHPGDIDAGARLVAAFIERAHELA